MSSLDRIEKDYLTAFKAKESEKVAVLRVLKTAIKHKQVELKRELTDEEVLDVIAKQAKQRQEAQKLYIQGDRKELAQKEEREYELLKVYLPEMLSPAELKEVVQATIQKVGAETMKDMGKVMGVLSTEYKGRIDGKEASNLVRSLLTQ